MLKRIVLGMFVLMIMMAGCAQAASINPTPTTTSGVTATQPATNHPTATPSSGIEGKVTEGPMCPGPVVIGDTQCQDQPYQAKIAILNADNQEIIQVQSDVQGHFSVSLTPGTYVLHPLSDKTLPRAGDQTVTVEPGQYTQVTVMYDTGMR